MVDRNDAPELFGRPGDRRGVGRARVPLRALGDPIRPKAHRCQRSDLRRIGLGDPT